MADVEQNPRFVTEPPYTNLETLLGTTRSRLWIGAEVWLSWGKVFRPARVIDVTPTRVRFAWCSKGTTKGRWQHKQGWVWPRCPALNGADRPRWIKR